MNKHNTIILFTALMFLVLPFAAWAIAIDNPLQAETFQELIEEIIKLIFNIALGVAPIMIIVAGFLFVIGGGSAESVQKAKNILLYTVVGLFIIMISRGLIEVIKQFLAT